MSINLPVFCPHPLVRGGHLQTIVGSYWPSPAAIRSALHRVRLADGDAIALHDDGDNTLPLAGTKPGPAALPRDLETSNHRELLAPGYRERNIAILVHGLAGSHQSAYMMRSSIKLRARGVHAFRMDLRGCGAGLTLARRPLHAGRSEDVAAVLDYVHRLCPESAIHLVGYSMGGNIALKLAGELGAAAPPYLASVTAVSPPIDLALCTRNLHRGINRVYDDRFVSALVKHVRQRTALVPDALARPLVPQPRRLVEFDSLFTAPLSGFADVHDYYERASSCTVLSKIAVSALIITAASDPIVPANAFEQASYSATTQVVIAPCGGHLGFVGRRGIDPDLRWLDWRIVDWVTSQAPRRKESPVAHQTDQRPVEDSIAAVGDVSRAVGQ